VALSTCVEIDSKKLFGWPPGCPKAAFSDAKTSSDIGISVKATLSEEKIMCEIKEKEGVKEAWGSKLVEALVGWLSLLPSASVDRLVLPLCSLAGIGASLASNGTVSLCVGSVQCGQGRFALRRGM
jgi:hypothetical protein